MPAHQGLTDHSVDWGEKLRLIELQLCGLNVGLFDTGRSDIALRLRFGADGARHRHPIAMLTQFAWRQSKDDRVDCRYTAHNASPSQRSLRRSRLSAIMVGYGRRFSS